MYRINVLLKQKQKLFHTQDLRLIWGVKNDNTLYTLISRYIKKGILVPIYKGLYATCALSEIDPTLLGISVLHQYAYKSCESVLVEAGIIFQYSRVITFVSSFTKKYQIGGHYFWSRRMKDKFLFNLSGITKVDGIFLASPERAAADMIYFNSRVAFDNPKGLNWVSISKIKKEVGFP